MALTPGTRIGSYEITAQIGVGGMGEVYRATDPNLARQVAIKVLPEAVAADAERLARFDREAKTLAALNHPNIAAIYGLEKSAGATALVMELVEGPTLADRIAEGAVPLDEALGIARQIAEALEAAHEQGIIHRDLKPANVKVRLDGTVKVLDFGLAKAMGPAGGSSVGQSMSPTITTPAMTQAGLILGTAAYMSPEQARGREADRRSDVWAFGVVLYEMLTGRRAFEGSDTSEVLAGVIKSDPDWSVLPELPPLLDSFLRQCLKKDPRQRIPDIATMRLALEGALDVRTPPAPVEMAVTLQPAWRKPLPVAVAAVAVGGLLAGFGVWSAMRSDAPPPVRFALTTPADAPPGGSFYSDAAISPDGRTVVYQSGEEAGGSPRLLIRPMDQLEATPLRGAEEAAGNPFFSPDGTEVGFVGNDGQRQALRRVSVLGGPAQTIAAPPDPVEFVMGASWGADGTVVFGATNTGLWAVPAVGGEPAPLTTADTPESHRWPDVLPNGAGVLFTIWAGSTSDSRIAGVSLETGAVTELVAGGSHPRYVSTGHIVYGVEGTLRAVAFDQDRLALTGTPVPVVERVVTKESTGPAVFAVAGNGSLVYMEGDSGNTGDVELVWVDRSGGVRPIEAVPGGGFQTPRLSPDGSQVLVFANGDAWVYDLADGRQTRVTEDGRTNSYGGWHPDGTRVAYTSPRDGNDDLWVEPVDQSEPPLRVADIEGELDFESWSPDGRTLAAHVHGDNAQADLVTFDLEEATEPRMFLEGPERLEGMVFSPDGDYVAYVSNGSGQPEVYVRPFPGPGGQRTVSVGGGREPVWAANGELFYRTLDGLRMMVVDVKTSPSLTTPPPAVAFDTLFAGTSQAAFQATYDVTADGQRFLMLRPEGTVVVEGGAARRLIVVEHWFEELLRRVPVN